MRDTGRRTPGAHGRTPRWAKRAGITFALAVTGLIAAPLALADRAHWADGYVWAYDETAASYDATGSGYAFNRTDRPIIITKPSGTTGRYLVRFRGLSRYLGSKSTVHVTAYGGGDAYCAPKTARLVNDVVEVRCYDSSDNAAVDSLYDVYVTRNYNDLAFAYAHRPTASGYAPAASASWNPSANGTMRVVREDVGSYRVNFRGLDDIAGAEGGHVQVNAVNAGQAYCTTSGWGGSPNMLVYVVCFNKAGNPVDARFNVLFALPNDHLAYAWANDAGDPSYTPSATYSDNPSGGAITATRSGVGQYQMTWTGAGAELLDGGDVQVTAYGGTNAQCNVIGWGSDDVGVSCFGPNGAPVDTAYDILYGS